MEILQYDLDKYVNESFTEKVIRRYEEQILSIMKKRYDKYPTEINDNEWLRYTNFVCRRRCQRNSNLSEDQIND